MRRGVSWWAAAALCLGLAGSAPARGGEPEAPAESAGGAPAEIGGAKAEVGPAKGDPHGMSGTWSQPPPAQQAAEDPNLAPAMTGAIFVPAMTDPTAEPQYVVRRGDTTVATTSTGHKTFVQPGTYTVLVGSGVIDNQLEFEAYVVEGRTTFIPVEWAGLSVNVVDRRGNPFRGSYELVRLPKRTYVGIGLGARIAEGETLNTWLLPPGKYMILAAGEGYQARKNFVTLRLAPGELVRYTLVLDEDTGDLLGGGEIPSARGTPRTTGWNASLTFGGSVTLNHSERFVGKADGVSIGVTGFVDALGGYRDDEHLFYGRFSVEVGGDLRLPDRPFVSSTDEMRLELLYAYKVTDWFGPYVRYSTDTQVLPAIQTFEKPTAVRRLNAEGVELGVEAPGLSFQLADPFEPVEIGAGTGARFDISQLRWMSLSARIGVGVRHVIPGDLYVVDDDTTTPDELEVRQRPIFTQFGAEAALIADVTMGRWVVLTIDTSLLVPFDTPDRPVIDFRGTLAFRLTSFASLNYTVRVREDPEISEDVQLDQQVLLRFAYSLP